MSNFSLIMGAYIALTYTIGNCFGVYMEKLYWEKIINNEKVNIEKLKSDCEKSGKQCVLVYEYIPTNTESENE